MLTVMRQAVSPAGSLPSPSPRRISRRDEDLGLPVKAIGRSPKASPASLASPPYQGSSDGGAAQSDGEDVEEISDRGPPDVSNY